MDRSEVEALLRDVAAGSVAVEAAVETLAAGPMNGSVDLGFARVDTHRGAAHRRPRGRLRGRQVGRPDGRDPDASWPGRTAAARRWRPGCPTTPSRRCAQAFPDALVDEVARAVAVGPLPEGRGTVCVVAAGTSDAPVAAEAAFVARAFGAAVDRVDDVGVAGIHRLMAVRDRLDAADCLVVVAGMEGALPSVVGGLTGVPLVAVPTSVGYGTSYGGLAALLAMLNSCAPGVVVCNIDNGFGAGVFAARVARRAAVRASA